MVLCCQTEVSAELVQGLEELGLVSRVAVYASTPSNSGGRGDFGCLLWKCCLKVFGSGICDCRKGQYIQQTLCYNSGKKHKPCIWLVNGFYTNQKPFPIPSQVLARQSWDFILTLHTRQVNTSAAFAAVFWSWPLAFFASACFLAFFCWDWIFWCPRAILAKPKEEVARTKDWMITDKHQYYGHS